MKRLATALFFVSALGLAPGVAPVSAAAPSDGPAQAQPRFRPRQTERQVQTILTRIRTNAESLVRTIDGEPARGRAYGNPSRQPDDAAYLVEDLARATVHLEDHIARQLTTRADVDEVFRRAVFVDNAFERTSPPRAVQTAWNGIRRDVDRLASAYDLRWDWDDPRYSGEPLPGVYRRLAGTYELDVARSGNPQRIIDAAVRTVPAADRTRVTNQLQNRLDPPERIAIDRTESRIVIASTRGPQITFDADGQPRTEQGAGGRTVTTRAALYGDQLEVITTGMANNEFAVTFEPVDDGQQLRVTRRVYVNALRQPVTLQSVYRKTSDTPDWDLYNRPTSGSPYGRGGRANTGLLVPDGTTLVARLDQTVDLRAAREDDRLSLTVRDSSRAELEGATIEGYVLSTPSRSDDRARVSIQFDQIRLRNGRSGDFDGVIERMTGPNGQEIRFDGEEAMVESNRGRDALKRGAIGAVLGGLIGAVAGGGKGAAIGAAIGGGGGAATVLIDGRDHPELPRGTEFRIRARTGTR